MEIRLAQPDDLEVIFKIWMDGLKIDQYSDFTPDVFYERLRISYSKKTDIYNYWVAEDEKSGVLGWISVTSTTHPLEIERAAKLSCYIHSESRSKNIGNRLMIKVMGEIENSNLEFIEAYCNKSNIAGNILLKKFGFKQVGLIPDPIKVSNSSWFRKDNYYLVKVISR